MKFPTTMVIRSPYWSSCCRILPCCPRSSSIHIMTPKGPIRDTFGNTSGVKHFKQNKRKLDQGHLGMSDPLRLDFYPSTPHKTHQTHRPTRPTGPQPDPGPTSSTGPLDQRAHHTKGPIHQGQQHLDPWWETVKKCEKQWEKVKNGDKRWEMVRKNE